MSKQSLTKSCVVCQKPFIVRTNNREHAKYCSKACQRSARGSQGTKGKADAECLNCHKQFQYYPSQGPGKYCSRTCRDIHWKQPSADRGFQDLTGRTDFGRWVVLSHAGRRGSHRYWNVRCSCPAQTEAVVSGQSLKRGDSRSCGCIVHEGEPRPTHKVCTRCNQRLPYDEEHFSKHPTFRWGLRPICIACWLPIARARHLRFRRRLKLEVLSHYSNGEPSCACCGVKEIEFLTLDHMDDDGKQDRKIHGIGTMFYARMKRLGYPPRLQVLCLNCNFARSHFGQCPHMRQKP